VENMLKKLLPPSLAVAVEAQPLHPQKETHFSFNKTKYWNTEGFTTIFASR
jgi:hypothetical protein